MVKKKPLSVFLIVALVIGALFFIIKINDSEGSSADLLALAPVAGKPGCSLINGANRVTDIRFFYTNMFESRTGSNEGPLYTTTDKLWSNARRYYKMVNDQTRNRERSYFRPNFRGKISHFFEETPFACTGGDIFGGQEATSKDVRFFFRYDPDGRLGRGVGGWGKDDMAGFVILSRRTLNGPLDRSATLMFHELGHAYGLGHISGFSTYMSNNKRKDFKEIAPACKTCTIGQHTQMNNLIFRGMEVAQGRPSGLPLVDPNRPLPHSGDDLGSGPITTPTGDLVRFRTSDLAYGSGSAVAWGSCDGSSLSTYGRTNGACTEHLCSKSNPDVIIPSGKMWVRDSNTLCVCSNSATSGYSRKYTTSDGDAPKVSSSAFVSSPSKELAC